MTSLGRLEESRPGPSRRLGAVPRVGDDSSASAEFDASGFKRGGIEYGCVPGEPGADRIPLLEIGISGQ